MARSRSRGSLLSRNMVLLRAYIDAGSTNCRHRVQFWKDFKAVGVVKAYQKWLLTDPAPYYLEKALQLIGEIVNDDV